jgi:outer membrane lipoprotein SlyB
MNQIQDWMGNITEFAVKHPRSVIAIGTATGAAVGCFVATSKLGLFVAAAAGVMFCTVAGATAGRVIGELVSRQHIEYIPPSNQ